MIIGCENTRKSKRADGILSKYAEYVSRIFPEDIEIVIKDREVGDLLTKYCSLGLD